MKRAFLLLLITIGFGSTDTTSINLTITNNTIDWVNLQWPENGTVDLGLTFNVYAQVYEAGVTNSDGQGSGIGAWVGYSSTNSDPSGTDWAWIPATYNADSGNNDEYVADIGSAITDVGTYYYASRFSNDGGLTYVYGGYSTGGGGFWDGTTYTSGTLTVTGNTAPILSAIPDQTLIEDVAGTVSLSATDADGDSLTYSVVGGSEETVIGTVNGSLLTLAPSINFNTSTAIQFIVTVTDGNGGSDSDTLDVLVTPVNDAPVIATLTDQTGEEGTELTFTISATDVDGDSLSWTSSNLPTGATLTDNLDGTASFTWTPDYTQAGTYPNVQFIVSDGQGGSVAVGMIPSIQTK